MQKYIRNIFKIILLFILLPFYPALGQNCVGPAYAEAGQVTGTTAVLYWMDYNGNTQWQCSVSTSYLSDPSTAEHIYNVTGSGYYMEYPIDGLTPETPYYFYIRSVCGTNLTSSWISGGTFTTRCGDKPVTYFCDFNGTSIPDCWTVVDGYPSIASADAAHPSTLKLPAYSIVALPSFNAPLSSLMVSFYIRCDNNSDPFEVGIAGDVADVSMSYETIESFTTATSGTFYGKQIRLDSYTGTSKYIVLYNTGASDCYIDDLTVGLIPDCFSPANVEARNITSHSAEIHWTEVGTATQWQGFLSTTPVTNFNTQTPQTLSNNSCTLPSLTPNTIYYYYVRSICGSEYSDWANISFTTACEPYSLPESESFSAQLPDCWKNERVNGDAGLAFVTSGTNPTCSPAGGSYMVKWESYTNNSGSSARLVSLPLNTMGTNVVNVHFMWHHSLQSPSAVNDGVQVQYSYDGVTWQNSIQEFIGRYDGTHNGWTAYDVAIPEAGNRSIVFIGFLFNSGRGGNCYLDEVIFEAASSCVPPVNVEAQNIGGNSATLAWDEAGAANIWNVVVSETPVTDFSLVSPVQTSTRPYPLTNLNPNTTYYAYVQARCSAYSTSEWVAAAPFTTECGDILTLPYEESFDRYGTCSNAFPPCWRRYGMPELGNFFHNGQSCTTPSATDIDAIDGDYSLLVCTPSGGTSYTVSPAIRENIRNIGITFYLQKSDEGNVGLFEIGLMSDIADVATFEHITTIDLESAGQWYFLPVSFENATADGPGYHIVFRHSGVSDVSYYLLDGIEIMVRPDCWSANRLTVSGVNGNSATFDWYDPNTPAAQWTLKISDTPMNDMTQTANVLDQTISEVPFTINYLQGNTTYYYYLQSNCGGNALGVWSSGSFTTLPCNCYIDIYMSDHWANTWEGSKIQLKHGSTVFAEATMDHNGARDTARIYTCDALNIDYYFVSGGYDSDISFTIVNSLGTTLYTTNGTPQAGCFYSGVPACGVSCGTAPTNLTATSTATGNQLTWEAAPEALCYTVYRNGVELDDYVTGLSYLDENAGTGNYCYTVTAQCIVGESGPSNESCITGIDDRDDNRNVTIFPNPAKDHFTVSADFPFTHISVVNLLGQEVIGKDVTGSRSDIDVSGLSDGIYLVKILDGSKWVVRKVVVE